MRANIARLRLSAAGLATLRVDASFAVMLADEIERLEALINTPHTDDFLEAVKLEAAHQRQRWGIAHDRSKSAENWFWLVGYLSGKALRAAIDGNHEKALHHTISSGAALLQWHEAIHADPTGVGLGADVDLDPEPNNEQKG
jgi:hypothetical protein